MGFHDLTVLFHKAGRTQSSCFMFSPMENFQVDVIFLLTELVSFNTVSNCQPASGTSFLMDEAILSLRNSEETHET